MSSPVKGAISLHYTLTQFCGCFGPVAMVTAYSMMMDLCSFNIAVIEADCSPSVSSFEILALFFPFFFSRSRLLSGANGLEREGERATPHRIPYPVFIHV